jgi:CBS domain-containing protein
VIEMATVRDVMSTTLLTVDATATLTEAASTMDARRVGAALVMNGEHLSGILTERDILHAVATGQVEGTKVGAWMTHDPETVAPEERPGHAAAIMLHGGFRHLPVVDGDKPVGILSIRDLMRLVIDDEAPRGV